MMQRIRFRSLEEAEAGERALERVVTVTVLPGGHLAVPDFQLDAARAALRAARIDFRDEPVEEFLGGRVIEEERDEGPEPSWQSRVSKPDESRRSANEAESSDS